MSTHFVSIQNSLVRCIVAAAVIFCTLLPNIAVCKCADCQCCEKTVKKISGCCSQKEASAEKNAEANLPSCCRHTDNSDAAQQKTQHKGCPCLLKETAKPHAVTEKAAPVINTMYSDNFFGFVPALTVILFDVERTFASVLILFWEHSAAPPLRLHLLLQVLVI